MPDSSLTAAIEEAYASAPADEIVYHTLEFDHPDFLQPIYVVRDRVDLTATLEDGVTTVTFTAFAFDFHLPPLDQTASPEIVISIDNVGSEIVPYLDAAAQSSDLITVTYRPYLSSDLSAPQMDPPITLVVRDVTADVFKVECRATFGDFANRKFPNDVYNAQRFPGLIAT
jgi:hypothetical protein